MIRETYSAYAEDYQQTFIYDVPDELPRVIGNPDRTQQVLISLLDNAFKYSPEDGTVTLSCRIEGDVLAVTVRDTGIGISQDDLPHVFDRFYKADKSHGGKGTGLGLAIAYEIMKQLGETMTVESTLGEGWWGSESYANYYEQLEGTNNPFNWIKVVPTMSASVQTATGYDHAGKYESSILMALYPDSVDLSRIDERKHWFAESAREASVELGNLMVEKTLEDMAKRII